MHTPLGKWPLFKIGGQMCLLDEKYVSVLVFPCTRCLKQSKFAEKIHGLTGLSYRKIFLLWGAADDPFGREIPWLSAIILLNVSVRMQIPFQKSWAYWVKFWEFFPFSEVILKAFGRQKWGADGVNWIE